MAILLLPMTASAAVAVAGDPRQLAIGKCYFGEPGDRPMSPSQQRARPLSRHDSR